MDGKKIKIDSRKKYDIKNNKDSKSYKLDKDLVVKFKEACDKIGTSQAVELEKFMKEFIERNK